MKIRALTVKLVEQTRPNLHRLKRPADLAICQASESFLHRSFLFHRQLPTSGEFGGDKSAWRKFITLPKCILLYMSVESSARVK